MYGFEIVDVKTVRFEETWGRFISHLDVTVLLRNLFYAYGKILEHRQVRAQFYNGRKDVVERHINKIAKQNGWTYAEAKAWRSSFHIKNPKEEPPRVQWTLAGRGGSDEP